MPEQATEVVRRAKLPSVLSIVTVLFIGLTLVFTVPYTVPVHDGFSFSYAIGFNNKVALFLLLFFSLGFGIWSRGLGIQLPKPQRGDLSSSNRIGIFAIFFSLFACLSTWIVCHLFLPIGEALYFIDRLEMFRIGGKVYRDFGFDYGPIMFYFPICISRLSGLSMGDSHYLAWTIQWIVGTWILWKTVEIAAFDTTSKKGIFLILWLFWISAIVDSSPSYTPLRFCCGPLLALLVCNLYAAGVSLGKTFGLANLGLVILFLYSPEQGIAFSLATLVYFSVCVRDRRPGTLLALVVLSAVTGAVTVCGYYLSLFKSINTFSGGALNFPLLPSPQLIVLLLFYFAAGCITIAAFRNGESNHRLMYLISFSLVTSPAALSRADLGHVLINSLGSILAVMVVASQYPRVWRWAWKSLAFVVIIAWVVHFTAYRGALRTEVEFAAVHVQSPRLSGLITAFVRLAEGKKVAEENLTSLREQTEKLEDFSFRHLPSDAHLFAPMGIHRRTVALVGNPKISTGYYATLFPLGGSILEEKIREIKMHANEPLILPSQINCGDDVESDRAYVRKLLLVPYIPPSRNRAFTGRSICDFILSHFTRTDYSSPLPYFEIWALKPEEKITGPE